MAVTESIRNLDFPTVTDKEATLDLEKVVTVDSEGDERYILTATPGTTTTAAGDVAIDPVLIEYFKSGYVRSSGFQSPPFTIGASNDTLQISIDGSTVRSVSLTQGSGLTGDDVADDLQTQINLLAATGGDEEGNLAFLNAIVSFENGKLFIISGSLARSFTGTGKSSISITAGASNDVTATLGLDIVTSSEEISSKLVTEAQLTGSTTSPSGVGDVIPLDDVTDLSAGDAFTIYDGTNREYFVATSVSGNNLLTYSGALSNTYASGSVVQNIFERDADSSLASPYRDVDEVVRAILRTVAVQIDFSG